MKFLCRGHAVRKLSKFITFLVLDDGTVKAKDVLKDLFLETVQGFLELGTCNTWHKSTKKNDYWMYRLEISECKMKSE